VSSRTKSATSVADAAGVLWETLDVAGHVRRHPYRLLAGAAGIGFVLGGGLFTRLAAQIASAGLRIGLMAALPVVQEKLVEAARASKWDTSKGDDQ
jgi:hypothetical protein